MSAINQVVMWPVGSSFGYVVSIASAFGYDDFTVRGAPFYPPPGYQYVCATPYCAHGVMHFSDWNRNKIYRWKVGEPAASLVQPAVGGLGTGLSTLLVRELSLQQN